MSEHPQREFLVRRWFHGESSLPLVQQLREQQCDDEAAAIARLALRAPECLDREALAAMLHEISSAPEGWLDALAEFAHMPSEERWDELIRFVPRERISCVGQHQ